MKPNIFIPLMPGQSGASLVESVVAAAILLAGLGAAFSLTENIKGHLVAERGRAEVQSYDSIVSAIAFDAMRRQATTDPCLKNHVLTKEIRPVLDQVAGAVKAVSYTRAIGDRIKDKLGKSMTEDWANAISYCNGLSSGQTACVFLEGARAKGENAPIRFGLAAIKQFSFDYKNNQIVQSGSCDNSEVLDPENKSVTSAGIGLKGTFFLVRAASYALGSQVQIAAGKSSGEVVLTPSKSLLRPGSQESVKFSPLAACAVPERCTAYPIPPNPAEDYQGWRAFLHPAAWAVSTCNKCERAPDYK